VPQQWITSEDVKETFYEELERVFDSYPKHNINIMLEISVQPTVVNESAHKIADGNAVIVVNFDSFKSLTIKCTVLSHSMKHGDAAKRASVASYR
jgi:SepF-like predicted cell division protein (DUF552 family)